MNKVRLGDVANVHVSGVDKKIVPGEVPIRLCNYTDVYYNWTIRNEMRKDFMSASARPEEIKKYQLHAGQVAITKDSETRDDIGHPTYIADDFEDVILGYHCALISPFAGKLDGQFLNALLRTRYVSEYFSRNAGGSGQRYYLSDFSIKNTPLFLPSFEDQLLIAGILGSLDEKIEINRRKIAEIEALVKTIFDYWFVQFDFPDASGRPYRSSGGAMEWKNELKREIPKGWGVGNLYDIASFENGLACQKHRPRKGEQALPVIKIREMHEGISADTEFVSVNIPEKNRIEDGDLLFSWSASLETMIWCGGKAGLNQHIFKVIPKAKYPMEYVYQQLSQYIINFVKMAEARKTTMGHITTDHLRQSHIILPDEVILSHFSDVTASIASQRIVLQQEIRGLIKLRDMLLPLLMNGQVELK